jgi:hypothetical protein
MRSRLPLLWFFAALAFAQTNPAALTARRWRQQHERQIADEFVALLSIPNVSGDRDNIRRNADTIVQMMQKRGVAARQVSVPGSNPVVFGEIRTQGAARTIGFYAHYDGQPLDPKEWANPPFQPTLRNGQLEKDGQIISLPGPVLLSIPNGASMPARRETTRRPSSPCWPPSTPFALPDYG